MAERMEDEQISSIPLSELEESKPEDTPIRSNRSKSIEDVQRQMVRTYVTSTGAPRTDFPDPKVSRIILLVWACLRKLGRGSLDHSLLVFHKNNRFRKTVKRAVKSKFFNIFFGIVVVLNALLLCVHVPTGWSDYKTLNLIVAYVSTIFLVAYIVEFGMRIIAYGLIFHPKAYLRSFYNFLDLCTILFGFLYLFLTLAGVYVLADIFGALMAIKLIRVLSVFKRVRFILRALAMSMVPLAFVSVMTLCVMVFFTFLGMELRQGCDLHSGCFANFTDPNGILQSELVSDFPCSQDNSDELGVHRCPSRSQCGFWEMGPNYGFTSFDNFLKGLLTVFQLLTLEGWSGVFYLYESACGVSLTWPYFITVITLGSVLFLNLWMGVLTSVFIGVSERQETETNIRQLKEKKKNDKDLENYRKWIQKSLEVDLPSESGSIRRRPSMTATPLWLTNRDSHGYDSDDEQYLDAQLDLQIRRASGGEVLREHHRGKIKYWYYLKDWVTKGRTVVLKVVKSRVYFFLLLLVLAVNLVLLMSLHFPHKPALDSTIFTLNYIFSCLFIMESLLGLFALGPKRYFSSHFHQLDLILNILNLLDLLLIPVLGRYHFSAIINACRSVKLVKIFKYTRYWTSIKQIINTFTQLLTMSASLMALVVWFLFIYTIIGHRIFGGRMNVDHTVGLPNFDNFLVSFLLVFQLMTTEDWHYVMVTSSRPWLRVTGTDYFSPIFFVSAITIGGFVLLSIFLSIAVDKLSEVKSVEQEEGREVEKKDRERKDKKRHINALKHPEQASIYRKTLRSARRIIEGITVDSHQKKDWQKPFSGHGTLKHQKSTGSGVGTLPLSSENPMGERKQSNPLRFVMNPMLSQSVLREQSAARASEMASSVEALDTDHRSSMQSYSTQQSEHVASDSTRSKSRDFKRKLSTASTPETLSPRDFDTSLTASYERTQSVPVESIPAVRPPELSPVYELEDEPTSKLEAIPEDNTIGEQAEEDSDLERSTRVLNESVSRPCPLSPAPPTSPTERDVTLRRTHVQSSLEDVLFKRRSKMEIDKESTEGFPRTRLKWKERLYRMWSWFADYIGTIQFDPKKELAEIPNHSAFFILSPDNSFRVFCYKLVCSKAFNVVTYVTIFLGSALLALEIPITTSLSSNSLLCLLQDVIIFVDLVIVIYFLVEMFLKMTALGVILHRGSYLRGFFNIMDFVITITTLIPIIAYFHNLGKEQQKCLAYSYQERLVPVYLATLRVFRVFRPMRAIRMSALFVVMTGLVSSIRSIGRILFINLLVLSIFAVIGTIIFRGSFFYCTDPNKMTEKECKGHFFTYPTGDLSCPELNERRWMRHGLNFDNFGQSYLTLFAMITSEGWQEVMYNAYNAKVFQNTNDPEGPSLYASPYTFIYFLLYMCIMTLVLLNMFIGFVIVTFQEVGIKAFRESKLDRNQRNCLYFALTAKPMFRYIPKFEFQKKLSELTAHPLFSTFIFIALVCNSIVLSLQSFRDARESIYWINFFFTVLFSTEAVLKIIAQHPVNYFKKIWNFVEFLSTAGAIIEFLLQHTLIKGSDFQYSHFFSSFRVIWLLRFVPQVRLIMWTVIKSLEIFPWVGLLLLVVLFTYSVVGMQVFGTIERAPIEASEEFPGRHITQYNNFANFPQALLVMIRVTTGENWPDVMLSSRGGVPCENNNLDKCGSDFSYFFYPFFYSITSILFLNLFVAIIIDNFDYLVKDKSILGAHQLNVFVKIWSIFDPSASGELYPEDVIKLMKQSNPPVGWGTLCPLVVTYRNMMNMNMPLVNGKVTFHATLFGLVKTALGIGCSGCPDCLQVCNSELKKKLRVLFPNCQQKILDEVLPVEDVPTVRPGYAVHLIQTRWRAFVRKRNETIQLFQGKERRSLIAGSRKLPDAGPELMERKLSDFELEDLSSLTSPPHDLGSRVSSTSAVRIATPTSLSGFRFNLDTYPYDNRQPSDEMWGTGIAPQRPLDLFPVLHSEDHPFSRQRDDDEHSDLSYTSAYDTPDNLPSPNQHRETTV